MSVTSKSLKLQVGKLQVHNRSGVARAEERLHLDLLVGLHRDSVAIVSVLLHNVAEAVVAVGHHRVWCCINQKEVLDENGLCVVT